MIRWVGHSDLMLPRCVLLSGRIVWKISPTLCKGKFGNSSSLTDEFVGFSFAIHHVHREQTGAAAAMIMQEIMRMDIGLAVWL